jgi:hypothetical protein
MLFKPMVFTIAILLSRPALVVIAHVVVRSRPTRRRKKISGFVADPRSNTVVQRVTAPAGRGMRRIRLGPGGSRCAGSLRRDRLPGAHCGVRRSNYPGTSGSRGCLVKPVNRI